VLDEGFNPYESYSDSGSAPYMPRVVPIRGSGLALADADVETADAPVGLPSFRDFDFAAAMFADDNAWREMARVIASDAA